MTLSPFVKTSILVAVGLIFVTAGLLTYFLFPDAFKTEVKKRLALSPTSETYEQWREPTIPIYLTVYFFNVTNPEEIYLGLSKPVLEEVGPYTFREERRKQNITWHKNGTVSYRLYKKYHFQPDLTNGSLDDEIISVNVPMLTIVSFVKEKKMPELMVIASEMLHYANSTLFTVYSARQLLFEGYQDMLLGMVKQIFPEKVPHDTFGWFYGKNNTDDTHTYTVFTGKNKIEEFGYVDKWNGIDNISLWEEPCNKIKGTTGEMWPPFRENRYEKLTMFLPDLCRSITLRYLSDQEVKGIGAYRYWLDNTAFDNGFYNAEHKCYCTNNVCLPSGGHDASTCQQGAPIVMSAPHFLYGDIKYSENIIGMRPNPKKHQFFVDLQPEMGIPINIQAKMQINAIVNEAEGILALQSVKKKIYYPVLWFTQSAQINDALAKKIQLVTEDVPYYVTVGSFLLVIVGGIFLMLAIIFAVRHMRTKKETKGIYTPVKVVKS